MAETGEKPKPPNCTSFFDDIYFCYSPVYQMREYYRTGTLDDCRGKWSDFYDCISLKTNPASDVRERVELKLNKPSMWASRTPEEAAAFWASQFPQCTAAVEAGKAAVKAGEEAPK